MLTVYYKLIYLQLSLSDLDILTCLRTMNTARRGPYGKRGTNEMLQNALDSESIEMCDLDDIFDQQLPSTSGTRGIKPKVHKKMHTFHNQSQETGNDHITSTSFDLVSIICDS